MKKTLLIAIILLGTGTLLSACTQKIGNAAANPTGANNSQNETQPASEGADSKMKANPNSTDSDAQVDNKDTTDSLEKDLGDMKLEDESFK